MLLPIATLESETEFKLALTDGLTACGIENIRRATNPMIAKPTAPPTPSNAHSYQGIPHSNTYGPVVDDFRLLFSYTAPMSRYDKPSHTVYMTFFLRKA